jgi:nitrogenase molybdenum-iron protein alpha chain
VQPPREGVKSNKINFKNFYESARPEIIEIFKNFDLDPVFLYCNSTVEELSHLSESLATTCICGTLGNYLGNGLEEKYGVPYVRSINQCGIVGFETWLREIGKVTGRSEPIEKYIEEQRAIYLPQIEEVKKQLEGKTAVLGMGPGYTFEVSRVLNELGIKVVWALAWHYDKKYENGDVPPSMKYLLDNDIDFEASVADQQNFEVMNILHKYKPDMYLSRHPGSTVWAIKNGTPAIYVADEYMIFGYKHTLEFAKTILDAINNRSFEENLAKRTRLPYTDWWYQQNVDKFLEETK